MSIFPKKKNTIEKKLQCKCNPENKKLEKRRIFLKNPSLPVRLLPRPSHRGASKHRFLYLELKDIDIVRNIEFLFKLEKQ